MNRTVLIVEDDEVIQKLIELRLKSLGHTVCGKVLTGEDAIVAARQLKPDIVVMDIQLKGPMDGIEAAGIIRKHVPSKIIFLTGYSDDSLLQRAKAINPDGYILKPFRDDDIRVAFELACSHQPACTL